MSIVLLKKLVFGALLLSALEGCGAIGLGIGSRVRTVREVEPDELEADQRVTIRTMPSETQDGQEIEGTVMGREETGDLVIRSNADLTRVAPDRIDTVAVRGSHWLTGLLVGVALDAAFLAFVSVAPIAIGGAR